MAPAASGRGIIMAEYIEREATIKLRVCKYEERGDSDAQKGKRQTGAK